MIVRLLFGYHTHHIFLVRGYGTSMHGFGAVAAPPLRLAGVALGPAIVLGLRHPGVVGGRRV